MKRPLELPGEYEAMREVLEREEKEEGIDRNAWKRSEWRDGEDLGACCNPPMHAPLRREKRPFLHVQRANQELFTARQWCLGSTPLLPFLANLKTIGFFVHVELPLDALALLFSHEVVALGTSP